MKGYPPLLPLAALIALVPAAAFGASNRSVADANALYRDGKFEDALKTYTEMAEKAPESPELQFNRGAAQFQLGDISAAKAAFEQASLLTEDPLLQALCSYNMGNCAVAEAGQQGAEDPKAALASLDQSLRYYKDALAHNSKLDKAAHNMETAKRAIQQLREQMEQQEKEQEHQQNEMKEKVEQLIEQQSQRNQQSSEAAEQQQDPSQADPSQQQLNDMANQQEDTRKKTEELSDSMQDASKGQDGSPMDEAREHTEQAAKKQEEAEEHLKNQDAQQANAAQNEALDELKQARDALSGESDDQKQARQQPQDGQGDQNQEGDAQQQPEPKDGEPQEERQAPQPQEPKDSTTDVPPPDATARDILNQEQRNKEERNVQKMLRIRPVEKDW